MLDKISYQFLNCKRLRKRLHGWQKKQLLFNKLSSLIKKKLLLLMIVDSTGF